MSQQDQDEQQERMVALSQKIGQTCDGQEMAVVQGALFHMQAQLILRMSGNELEAANKCIDAYAAAMKEDVRQNLEQMRAH